MSILSPNGKRKNNPFGRYFFSYRLLSLTAVRKIIFFPPSHFGFAPGLLLSPGAFHFDPAACPWEINYIIVILSGILEEEV
jgi:hypothetical protein